MVIYTHYIPIKPKYTKATSPIMVGQIQHYNHNIDCFDPSKVT